MPRRLTRGWETALFLTALWATLATAALVLVVFLVPRAQADTLGVNVSCCSYHFSDRDDGKSWNETNPGLFLDWNFHRYGKAVAGGFLNSEDSLSALAGVGPRLALGDHFEASLPVGVVSGYSGGWVFAMPTVSLRPSAHLPLEVNFHFLPKPPSDDGGSAALALSIQVYEFDL